jgi:hypothetical protein
MTTDTRLQQIGDELQRAVAADLRPHARGTEAGTRRRRGGPWLATRRRRLAAIAAVAVAVPGVAYAAGAFTSSRTVARTLPRSDLIFGSGATCTVVRPNVEYHCTLAKAPPPDPITHLTPKQWDEFLSVKVPGRRESQTGPLTPREIDRWLAARGKVLASFGFTPAQIAASIRAWKAGTAGTGPGQFKGTVEPTLDASRRVNGGCRAINGDGTQWECYLGQAAVKERIVSGVGGKPVPGGPGVG